MKLRTIFAALAVAVVLAFAAAQDANAGLFNRGCNSCCEQQLLCSGTHLLCPGRPDVLRPGRSDLLCSRAQLLRPGPELLQFVLQAVAGNGCMPSCTACATATAAASRAAARPPAAAPNRAAAPRPRACGCGH